MGRITRVRYLYWVWAIQPGGPRGQLGLRERCVAAARRPGSGGRAAGGNVSALSRSPKEQETHTGQGAVGRTGTSNEHLISNEHRQGEACQGCLHDSLSRCPARCLGEQAFRLAGVWTWVRQGFRASGGVEPASEHWLIGPTLDTRSQAGHCLVLSQLTFLQLIPEDILTLSNPLLKSVHSIPLIRP